MGLPMCLNLLHHKNDPSSKQQQQLVMDSITAFDINEEALSKAEMAGAKPVSSLKDLLIETTPQKQHDPSSSSDVEGNEDLASSNVIITMLPDCKSVEKVINELITTSSNLHGPNPPPSLTFIDCSSISPSLSIELHSLAKSHGHIMLDAPVSGGVSGATNATLTFMVGGQSSTLHQTKPLLEIMGKNIMHCGDDGMGIVAKLCNNMALASQMIGISEAMNLGDSLGIDPNTLAKVMNVSTAKCWSGEVNNPHPEVEGKSGVLRPALNEYEGGFGTGLMLKDVRLAVRAGESAGVALPVAGLSKELYGMVDGRGLGRKDFGIMMQFLSGKV
eukprot:CAMPEP_0195517622 /NCGR_PEP_ID=MMETSP0794_2-20130614/11073_1 /TAXON_ID=515487 /ORGANISM="Stephanopyxis turris, Strain CCMP 815" /LENGTH=330 /DNA_ID=CAMNT_0040646449 /DNA_START=419 /DNA_END=1411 /DNA_ORIENTATION=-